MKKIKVRHHNRIASKTGRISQVKDFERSSRFYKLKKFIKNHINDNSLTKNDVIKFVIKELKIKDRKKIKKIASLVYMSLVKKQNEQKQEKEERGKGFKFYLGSEYLDIKNKNSIDEGNVFYNQKIDKNEIWGDTLKRKDLLVIQVDKLTGKVSTEKGRQYNISFIEPIKNGKKLKIENKKLYAEEIFNILKRGK